MMVFTVAIIGMNSIYILVVIVLFTREYVLEKMESRDAKEHEKMVSKLAAQLHAEQQVDSHSKTDKGGEMIDAAASLLQFTGRSPGKNKAQKKLKRRLTKKAMTVEQMEKMELMLHTQRAYDNLEKSEKFSALKRKTLKSEREYQKGRLTRRLRQRTLESKMGIVSVRSPTKNPLKNKMSMFSKRKSETETRFSFVPFPSCFFSFFSLHPRSLFIFFCVSH